MNPFKVGDVVTPLYAVVQQWSNKFTIGKRYQVVSIKDEFIRLVTDGGANGGWAHWDFEAVALANPHGSKPAYPHITGLDADYIIPDEEEDTYEERKARARVTSVGSFEKGDKVVYKDGTPINTEYGFFRVTRCTATAVWFEHCYSMPFNPTEFKRA